ncbi:hypothetical protein K8W59_08990 [Nocardioides rotundus]|uniref:hypothetical protein n=1 Tax=Nocardioides rotundus TaxID=1774216 RepID=UPI001CBDBE98|nr:hypothetical protein [Nocardioides rotundus]UAL31548.1 hypothetical protein K8W59_08990 [Nocardioides rotundus]
MTDDARRIRVVLTLENSAYLRNVKASGQTTDATIAKNRAAVAGLGDDFDATTRSVRDLSTEIGRSERAIDSFSGRAGIVGDALLTLGPAAIPALAATAPLVGALGESLGTAALAGGTAALAFRGVGDALGAVQKAKLEPTVANLAAARQELQQLSPPARAFVLELSRLSPVVNSLTGAAASGLFPGLTSALTTMADAAPRAREFLREVGDATGDVAAASAADLTSGRWSDFVDFLQADARPNMQLTAEAALDLGHGLSELWMQFSPANNAGMQSIADAADAFDRWASSAQGAQAVNQVMGYMREVGPEVAEATVAIASGLSGIVEAAAPLGGPALNALEAFSNVVGGLARSDLGTPLLAGLAAWRLYTRATQSYDAVLRSGPLTSTREFLTQARTGVPTMAQFSAVLTRAGQSAQFQTAQTREARAAVGGYLRQFSGTAGAVAQVGTLTAVTSGLTDKLGVTNTASLALAGSMAGPLGAAVGGVVGGFLDIRKAGEPARNAIEGINEAIASGDLRALQDNLRAARTELADLEDFGSGFGDFFSDVGKILAAGPRDAWRETTKLESSTIAASNAIAHMRANSGGIGDIFARDLGVTNRALVVATGSAREFRAAMASVNATLSGRASMRDYEAALDNLRATWAQFGNRDFVKNNGKFKIGLEGGRQVEAALDNIAAESLRVAENFKGMDRVRFMRRARADFIENARLLDLNAGQARQLATELGLLGNKKAKPGVDLMDAPFRNKLRGAERGVNEFDRKKGTATIDGNNKPASARLSAAERRLAAWNRALGMAEVDAKDNASNTIAAVGARLRALDGNRARTYVETVYTSSGKRFKDVPSGVPAAAAGPAVRLPGAPPYPSPFDQEPAA